MKTNQPKIKSFLFGVLMAAMFCGQTFAQKPNDYNVCIRNIHQTSPNIIELDVWLEWTGTNTQKFLAFQGGMNFNYDGLSNGGVITGAFVPGSADPALPAAQQAPNWNVNPVSKQIRFLAAIATPASIAVATPAPPGFRLGTLRLTNTVPFKVNTPMNFEWSFLTGNSNTTQSKELFYLNGSPTGTGFSGGKENSGTRKMRIAEGGGCRLSASTTADKLPTLSAFPNPTSGKLKVTFTTESKSKYIIKVTDMLGNVVVRDQVSAAAGENTKDLDLSSLAKGMYYLSMEMEDSNVQSILSVVIE